uniref:DUF7588 domain-containing protein n=1 Tax=Glycine max TaxID=3847 RepID=A0A0R0GG52_SOYBN
MSIDAAILMCLRDIRHKKFEDSLIGTVETSLGQGPIYFNCYPNKTVSLMDRNILDFLFLNIHFHGLDMKEGSIPAALIYRIQYKVMNTCASRVLLKPLKGETTLFVTDMTKANVSLPRTIKWDEVTLPEKWVMDKTTSFVPQPAPTIEQIKQDNSGKVEITFNRRNSLSSRLEASRYEYESARRSFSVRTHSIPVGLTRSESHNQFPTVNLQGLDTTSSIPRTTYNQEQEDDQNIDKQTLRKDFYSPENEPQRRWFVQHFKGPNRKQIQEKFYEFVERVKINTFMASPFKTKDINEEVTSKDIKSLMEHANYTNKYLQVLGESFKAKTIPKHKSLEESQPNIPMEKPLFKPFKISDKAKQKIRELRKNNAVKTDLNGKVITNDNNKEIPDTVNTLIFTIAQHFIGDPSLWKDRSAELLSNLKCRTLADFRWYRDTFLTRVYTREDSQQPFWKENFLAGLPRSLGEKVRDKIHSQSTNGDIPYESLSYGQLISYVQKVALKICQDDTIQRQLAKEKAQTKRDLGKQGHISKYCRLKRKLRNLNLEPAIEEQINNLLIETSEEVTETETSSSTPSDENLNIVQQDDQ